MKKKKVRLILSDKLYIPRKFFDSLDEDDQKLILEGFTFKTVNPNTCNINKSSIKCDLKESGKVKHCGLCEYAVVILKAYSKNFKWVKLDRGDWEKIDEVVEYLKSITKKKIVIEDRRSFPKLKEEQLFSVHFKKLDERKKDQIKICKKWLKIKYGQIVCPPRFGKTILVAMLLAKVNTRSVIIVHRKELIDQFLQTFHEFTNIQDQEKFCGRKLVKINPKPEEIDGLSVALYTWQQFARGYGLKKLKKVRDKFGIVVVDEAHRSSSGVYSQRLSRFKAKYRCGLTATPKRKDNHEFIGNNILGPPMVQSKKEQLPIRYRYMDTGFVLPDYKNMGNREWNWFWNKISTDRERNEFIAEFAKRDIKKGHKIIIPVKRVKQIELLAKFIKKEFENSKFQPNICMYADKLVKKKDRERLADGIRAGDYDVVIATSTLISEGFNAPAMSCLYEVIPIFSVDNLYQEYSRIRTKSHMKKRKPFVRVFIDDGDISMRFRAIVEKEFNNRGFREI